MNLDPETLFHLARKLHQEGRTEAAVVGYREVLALAPEHPHARYLFGIALSSGDGEEEALPWLQAHLKQRPDHVPAWLALGSCFAKLKQVTEAGGAYQQALKLDPRNVEAVVGIGNLLEADAKWAELRDYVNAALRVHADSVPLLGLLVRALNGLEEHKLGLKVCADYLAQYPFDLDVFAWAEEFFESVHHPDETLLDAMQAVEAIKFRVLYFRCCLRGKCLQRALDVLDIIHRLDPDHQQMTLEFTADALQNAEFYGAAAPWHWELLAKKPLDNHRLARLVDNTLRYAKNGNPEQYLDARELARKLIERSPDAIESYSLMANVYMHASRPELALPYFDKVVQLDPDHPTASPFLFTQNYDESRDPDQVFKSHVDWGVRYQRKFKPRSNFDAVDFDPQRRLRVGYISPDMGLHPVGFFSIDVFKNHNPEQVEVFIYSNRFQEVGDDALSQEFRSIVGDSHWRWTRGLRTEKVLQMIEADGIDVLVDMAGHTSHNRLDVLASRAAPVQLSWLGYANTTGLSQVDYRLSDAVVEPEGEADLRSVEKIYRMPNGFHMIRMDEDLPLPTPPPCLSRGHVTFGSYNNMNKLGSRSIELWAKLLKRVPRSKILLKHKTLAVLDNREALRSLFAMHGIQAHRVVLRSTTPGKQEHFASYGDMDIALDPLAYNGTTTSCDALLMGVPILTLPGRTHASRVTASLLHRVGLDGWVASDEEEFLRIGALAAQNMHSLKELRPQLRSRFLQSPLGNGPLLAADLEQAYRNIWQERCSNVVGAEPQLESV